ncbi:DUF1707 domain-containing protein [Nonomuraea diastatica]|uniref:DUF1707 SHOCT-like domain-containing protein n=1 Tax=Nonomuraea diastatica TaxID=1848329 RepID=UPI00319E0462
MVGQAHPGGQELATDWATARRTKGSGPEPREVRASDVDRDRVAQVLNDALAMDEFEERLTAVYSAKTLGELAGLTEDLLPAEYVVSPIATCGNGCGPQREAALLSVARRTPCPP